MIVIIIIAVISSFAFIALSEYRVRRERDIYRAWGIERKLIREAHNFLKEDEFSAAEERIKSALKIETP